MRVVSRPTNEGRSPAESGWEVGIRLLCGRLERTTWHVDAKPAVEPHVLGAGQRLVMLDSSQRPLPIMPGPCSPLAKNGSSRLGILTVLPSDSISVVPVSFLAIASIA